MAKVNLNKIEQEWAFYKQSAIQISNKMTPEEFSFVLMNEPYSTYLSYQLKILLGQWLDVEAYEYAAKIKEWFDKEQLEIE